MNGLRTGTARRRPVARSSCPIRDMELMGVDAGVVNDPIAQTRHAHP